MTARAARFPIAVALAGLALSGCSGGDPVFSPTMTQQHASARVEQIMRDTAAALSPRPRLEIYKPGSGAGPCVANPADTADTRIQVGVTYWLRDIGAHDYKSIGEQTLRLWKHKGYMITNTQGLGTNRPNVFAVTQDDFYASLEWSAKNLLSIGTTSPCLWPHGTPPPGH